MFKLFQVLRHVGFQKSATELFSVAKLSTQIISHVHRGDTGLYKCHYQSNLEHHADDIKPQFLFLDLRGGGGGGSLIQGEFR